MRAHRERRPDPMQPYHRGERMLLWAVACGVIAVAVFMLAVITQTEDPGKYFTSYQTVQTLLIVGGAGALVGALLGYLAGRTPPSSS